MSRREPLYKVTEIGVGGGAGGEGLEAALRGADHQDGGDDEEVGCSYEHSGDDHTGGQEEVQYILVGLFHITCQLHQGHHRKSHQ